MLNYNMNGTKKIETYAHTPILSSIDFPFSLISAGHYQAGSEYYTERTDFNQCLMIYTLSGSGSMTYNHEKSLLPPHSLTVINCNHYQLYQSEGCAEWEFLWVHFDGTLSFQYTDFINQMSLQVFHLEKESFFAFFKKLVHTLHHPTAFLDVDISYYFNDMLTNLIHLKYNQIVLHSNKNNMQKNLVEKAMDYIACNYEKPIHIDDLSLYCNISKFYFIKLFKEMTGLTPHKYINIIRINHAKRLLVTTCLTIEQVALQVGFCDSKCFITNFKATVGVTPLYYKKSSI